MSRLSALIASFLTLCGVSQAQEATFSLTDLDGKTAHYEHRYSVQLTSDRGEQLAYPGGGAIDVEIQGAWKSRQTRTVNDSGEVVARSTIKEGDAWAKMGGRKLTFEQFPFTLGQLNDEAFTWSLDADKGAYDIQPDFRPWGIRNRTDVINDVATIWFPGLFPVLPDGPVSEGDTWTGERSIERPFYALGARQNKFQIVIQSTYKVTDIEKDGDRRIVEIEEKLEIPDYVGWIETVGFSVLMEEGSGSGKAEWKIDASRGLVEEVEYTFDISRPVLRRMGAKDPVPDANSNLKVVYDAELKDLKK